MRWSLALVAASVAWAGCIVWSIRVFWWTSDSARQGKTYALVKRWATLVTLGSAILLPLDVPILEGPYWLNAAFWALWIFPFALCGGYFFSRIVLAILDPGR